MFCTSQKVQTPSPLQKKSRLQAFQTLGKEMKKFFKRRIPNNFTITPINFGLEGIVYPLLLCLDRNSDGLLTNFLFFLGLSVGGKRYIHISTIYPKRGGKILGLRGLHILKLVWCLCYNSFNSWNILVYRIWSYMSELLWNKYNQLSANGHSDCSTYWHFEWIWATSNWILAFAQRFLGLPRGKHCMLQEGNIRRKVVSISKKKGF